MERELNVLVLGAGGNVSQGILKALALSALKCRVVSACVEPEAAGLHLGDRACISPYATDPSFVDWLFETCRKERIDAVFSGVEPVLLAAAPWREALRKETGAVLVASSPETLAIGADKLRTARWLEEQGFHYPLSEDAQDAVAVERLVGQKGFPLIAKPRQGKGSFGIFKLENRQDLERAMRCGNYVIQEYLGSEETEYTAGCFSDGEGRVRGILVMRRRLCHGTTILAEAGRFPEVRQEAERIAAALKPFGPCNAQLRMAGGRPVCFEVNIRYSGTTPMRARLGFNDVEAALRHYVLGEPARDLPLVTQGIVARYWNEAYLNADSVELLRQAGGEAIVLENKGSIETYGTAR